MLVKCTRSATDLQRGMDGAQSASQRAPARLANPHDHPEGMRMQHAKFHAGLLKTVAVHKNKETQTHTDTQAQTHTDLVLYIHKTFHYF